MSTNRRNTSGQGALAQIMLSGMPVRLHGACQVAQGPLWCLSAFGTQEEMGFWRRLNGCAVERDMALKSGVAGGSQADVIAAAAAAMAACDKAPVQGYLSEEAVAALLASAAAASEPPTAAAASRPRYWHLQHQGHSQACAQVLQKVLSSVLVLAHSTSTRSCGCLISPCHTRSSSTLYQLVRPKCMTFWQQQQQQQLVALDYALRYLRNIMSGPDSGAAVTLQRLSQKQ